MNIKLILEYNGSGFYGWQYQPRLRTVQSEVERALEILLKEKVSLIAAGRTDAGVHALGQVANFRTTAEVDLDKLPRSLNGILSGDVVVKKASTVPESFHARFDAVSRQYLYVLSRYPVAVGRQFAYFVKFPLNLDAIRASSKYLLGEHNFRAFCMRSTDDRHYLCRIERLRWHDHGDKIVMRIRANRFLRSMVRIIVGTSINVGRGVIAPAEVRTILENQKRLEVCFTAPPHGLFLERVDYRPQDRA